MSARRARTRRLPTCTSTSLSPSAVITPSILIERTCTFSPRRSGRFRALVEARLALDDLLDDRGDLFDLLLDRLERFQRLARAS